MSRTVVDDVWEAFRVRWTADEHFAEADVFAVSGRYEDGRCTFLRDGGVNSMETVDAIDGAESYLKARVKWDGCIHWTWGNGADHTCYLYELQSLAALMRYLWERAFNLMEREPPEVWDG